MELIHGRHKTSMFATEDVISNMPDIVITNILDRLPLQDAVRTGVLARNWRFKWTLLSQLIFDQEFCQYLSKTKNEKSYARIISRLLLHLRGTITKFVLTIDKLVDAEDINYWILFLSRKGIKDLTLKNIVDTPLILPTHLFSCLELKHLKIYKCCFHPPPSLHGFPNLLSLELHEVVFGGSDPGEFFTRCRLLESLKLCDLSFIHNEKPLENVELENLKILSLRLCDLDHTCITSSCTIFELLGSLPKLQELHLEFYDCGLTEGDDAKERFFPCLKALKLSKLDVDDDMKLSCAFELIRSFPNLQTLEIESLTEGGANNVLSPAICSLDVDYDTMGPLQFQNVVFTICCEKDLSLMEYLLVSSPFLKKFVIHFDEIILDPEKKLMLARKVLKLQRAYPAVDMDLY